MLIQVDPETRPGAIGPPFTGHFRVIVDTPRGLQPFQPGPAHSTLQAGGQRAGPIISSTPSAPITMDIRRNIYDTTTTTTSTATETQHTNGVKDKTTTYHCLVCGVDCTNLRFHCTKSGQNIDLCTNCYHETRFPANLHSGDFIKLDSTSEGVIKRESNEWTEQELLLLLEGIEIYDEDWDQIAAHVGSHSRESCVLKFLQLPIEEPYLDETKQGGSGTVPISQADNPVLSAVAFLASVVDAKIAARASGRAIEELKSRLRSEANKESTGEDTSQESALEKAASVAIGSAAAKAYLLGEYASGENIRILNQAINMQLRKIEAKLSQFDDLEAVLEHERRELERTRQEVYCERLALRREVERARELIRRGASIGGEKGAEVLDPLLKMTGSGPEKLEVVAGGEVMQDEIEELKGGEGMIV